MSSRPTTTLAAVSNAVPPTRTPDPVVGALTAALSKMKSVLPTHITAEKMARLSLGELRLNEKLREAAQSNPESLVSAVMLASQCGLEIGGAKGHGYLVPYFNGKTKRSEVKFIPGYRGLIDLSRRSGQVTSISVHIAYENDEFDMVLGIDERLTHKPKLDGDRGAPRLVYGVARFTDGSHHFDWMPIGEVDAIMRGTQSKGDWGPWKDHKPEMIRKTMVRRLTKYLPMSSDRLEKAVDASDAFDAGQTIDVDGRVVEDEPSVGEIVDRSTGEIVSATSTAAEVEQDGIAGPPSFTFAQVQDAINKATDIEALDEAASLIASCAGGKKQQTELTDAYKARRAQLGGN